MTTFPPAPRDKNLDSPVWRDWLNRVRTTLSSAGTLFSELNFTGSNLTSIATRDHNDLTSKQGGTAGEYYHLTQAENTTLANSTTGTWTPTFTNLTVVLGAGSITYTGRYQRIGPIVKFIVKITPSGGATTSSTAGSTYCDMAVPAGQDDTNVAASVTTLVAVGTGFVDSANDRIYPPGWTATTNSIIISGWYEV